MTQDNRGFQITAKDIKPRPENLPLVTGKPGQPSGSPGLMDQIKNGMKQAKEFMDLARELGIDGDIGNILGGLGIKIPGKGKKQAEPGSDPGPSAGNAGAQVKNFLRLMQIRYGDITINELLQHLQRDFGSWKLSDFLQGKLQQ